MTLEQELTQVKKELLEVQSATVFALTSFVFGYLLELNEHLKDDRCVFKVSDLPDLGVEVNIGDKLSICLWVAGSDPHLSFTNANIKNHCEYNLRGKAIADIDDAEIFRFFEISQDVYGFEV